MPYDMTHIQEALGKKFNPKAVYVLARSADIVHKVKEGFVPMGTLPDSTDN